ncbi:MAG: hypothetical protein R3246_16685, partial [Acidimicrobiia bacterium]|nr:hypothetical protein [Acidimicrobiia bacterium]
MKQRPDPDAAASMWSSPADDQFLFDADCSPTKTCKNMVGISFDGMADSGTDLQSAWRATLEREGKQNGDGASLRD